jgi:hypothetical protein
MIPGALVWLTLVAAVLLSWLAPLAVIYFIIIFDLFWLFRVCYFVFYVTLSWRQYRHDIRVDWLAKVSVLPRFNSIYHLIFLPTYKEGLEIIRPALRSLVASAYPKKDRFIVVLAGEEGDREHFLRNAAILESEFGSDFFRFLVTVHPKGLPDEIPGKGSNINWAGHRAQEFIDELQIPYEDIIVSSFDCDTCVHPQYFACLTYKYLTHPDPTHSSYQPVALYNNNMWESSAVIRTAAFGTTFWLLTELARPERLFTFASHSMPFKMLVDVGFWEKDIVTEDSRIFIQGLLHYDGDYSVTPIYVPVSMDTVMSDTLWKSLVALYKQQRRWAWGVEHLPYLVDRLRRRPNFPLHKKIYYVWNQLDGMYSWATAPLLIFILGYLPIWLAPEALKRTALYQNTPHTLENLMTLSMIGVLVSAILSLSLLPPRPAHRRKRDFIVMLLQWALVPVTFVLFGSIPAVDAQTRLMLGKYLGFNVTEKKRKLETPALQHSVIP